MYWAPCVKLMTFMQAEDDGQPERQQRVERAVDQAEQQLAEQRLRRYANQLEHGARFRSGRPCGDAPRQRRIARGSTS